MDKYYQFTYDILLEDGMSELLSIEVEVSEGSNSCFCKYFFNGTPRNLLILTKDRKELLEAIDSNLRYAISLEGILVTD